MIAYPYSSGSMSRPYLLARRQDSDASIAIINPSSAETGASAALFNINYWTTSAEIHWNGTTVASSTSFLTAGSTSNTLVGSKAEIITAAMVPGRQSAR